MALSTTQYGYIIDPMVPFTDDKGKTIKDGFVRVFVAGSSTPVITYRNFDGAANQDLIELDNSGRTKTSVIGSKGLTYKVCVYDQLHSQESPILTVDKVSVIGANITAGSGATVVTGLDGLTTKPNGFIDASVVGTDGYVAIDHTIVTDDLDTDAKVTAVEDDRYVPLLNEDVNDPDSKMKLGRLWQWVLSKIKSLSTTITAFRTGDVIPVDGPSGTAKMPAELLVTHDELKDFSDIVEPIFNGAPIDLNDTSLWEQGGIVSNSGNPYAVTTRLRTANFIRLCGNVGVHTHNSATTQMYAYTENETFIGSVGRYFNQGALENYVASHPEAAKFKIVVVCNTDVLPAQLATYINFDDTNNYTSGRFFGLQKLIENEQTARKNNDTSLSASIATQSQRITDNADAISVLMASYYTQLTLTIVNDKYRNARGVNFTDYEGSAYAVVPVKAGEKYKLSARVGMNIRTYVITNSSDTITRAAASETWTTTHNYDVEVTIDENEAFMYVNSLGASYIGVRQEGNYPLKGVVYNLPNSIDGSAIKDNSIPHGKIQGGFDANPLFGKVAIFDGDSICHGTAGQSPSDPDYAYGWAGRIGTRNSMTWKNYGISGGTVTANTYSWNKVTTTPDWEHNTYYKRKGRDQSTDVIDQYPVVTEEEWDGSTQLYTKGSARHWESADITTMHSEYPAADYVILEACLNDAFNAVPFGTLSEGFSETLNASTYYGAFETMLLDAITNFPTAKIGLIIPYRPSADVNAYQDKALEVACKYSIPVLDLRYDSGLCQQNNAQSALLFYDNTHINQDGYDFITPKIEAWMKQL